MSDAQIVTFTGGWPSDLDALLGPDPDAEYEEALRICRKQGHDLTVGFNGDGREFLLCLRCSALFEEVDP